jgi:hypothetical protein
MDIMLVPLKRNFPFLSPNKIYFGLVWIILDVPHKKQETRDKKQSVCQPHGFDPKKKFIRQSRRTAGPFARLG